MKAGEKKDKRREQDRVTRIVKRLRKKREGNGGEEKERGGIKERSGERGKEGEIGGEKGRGNSRREE